jgi:aldehyde dehydrogenase (NAD+)
MGPVTDAAAAIGPVISERTRQSIMGIVSASGAERVYEGVLPAGDAFDHGYFVAPLVLRGVAPDSDLAQQELFGPVLTTFAVDDLDEAISLANRTRYGLSASVFTNDLGAAMRYIDRIEVGLVRVNGDTTGVDPHAPFGGVKGSSSGSREQGHAARDFYTEIRTVQVSP